MQIKGYDRKMRVKGMAIDTFIEEWMHMDQKRCTKKWTAAKRRRQSMTVSESRYRADKTERPGGIHRKYFVISSAQDGMPLEGMMVIPSHPRAILQIAHGMCEHKERYLPFMRYMAERGYLCVIHDHRGHGASRREAVSTDADKVLGKKQDIPAGLGYFGKDGGRFLVRDLHQITRIIKKQYPGLPYFMMGHSMGSLAVRCYLKKYDRELDGLIVCGCPGKNPMASLGSVLIQMLQKMKDPHSRSILADGIFANMFDRPFRAEKLIHAWICSDHTVVEKYNKDPLCNFTFTLNGYESLLWLMRSTYDRKGWELRNPYLPILFVSGEDDPCLGGRKKLLQAVQHLKGRGYDRVSFRMYPGMRHEILNEKGRFRVYHDIAYFLRKSERH